MGTEKYLEELRQRAEGALTDLEANEIPVDVQRVFEELQLYQAELQIQNEDLRNTQRALLAMRSRYADLYHKAPVGYATVDSDGLFLTVNDTFTEMVQKDLAHIVSRPLSCIIHADSHPEFFARFNAFRRKPEGKELIARLNLKERECFVSITGRHIPESWDEDSQNGLFLAFADVSDTIKRDAELQDQHAMLELRASELEELSLRLEAERNKAEEATQAKSNFLAVISHELRTPMTGILGYVDLLGGGDLTDKQKDELGNLKNSAYSMLGLINDILDFSKLEQNKIILEEVSFDLPKLVSDTSNMFRKLAEDKGLALSERHGALDGPLIVKSDFSRIQQVLRNLLSNAIKFTQKGGVTIYLSATKNLDGSSLINISVEDTGIGIQATDQASLFQPFTQVDVSTTRNFGGTGLGLSICKNIVQKLRGEIWLDSTYGKGTTFTVQLTLPPGDANDIVNGVVAEEADLLSAKNYSRDVKVLLVEDNDINRTVISTILRNIGYDVDEAENGLRAVEKARKGGYDIIFMDIQMPEMDGHDATLLIRQFSGRKGQVPILALTADVQAANDPKYQDVGFTAFLTKPVNWEMLQRAVDQHVLS